jgi:hypothetical protein
MREAESPNGLLITDSELWNIPLDNPLVGVGVGVSGSCFNMTLLLLMAKDKG